MLTSLDYPTVLYIWSCVLCYHVLFFLFFLTQWVIKCIDLWLLVSLPLTVFGLIRIQTVVLFQNCFVCVFKTIGLSVAVLVI